MTRDGKLISYQDDLQAGAMFSTIQPAVYWRAGIPARLIPAFFTSDRALAVVHLRKEGDTYVRN